ncbi:MAG: YebC/PmpR family DNA-binding transcriptional regulator [Actinobacteria bacterium]|nr:YebC/PmpR family DNA-binding transcriptional regulator [Actinomycetota bacterium]MBU4302633.1 YebC/PmpR family DNA-binding transcriptional regulator [Actinomycetota bacterium]MBU4385664.1 YebC/PmpR family DNA-binding transcriptional regulator [Actinomycetota bacterium]MBU4490133.1 YebC/PmpR family DNA-binding transcriptional regulator [Actinomycetota bacterium]
MSGHSKWHSIKHKKGKEDDKRGKIFGKLSQKIIIAAREGGGNPDMNAALATAIEAARGYSMPMDNIKRAIKKGTGELAGGQLEQMSFEGYGAGGVAVLVEVLTDNRNRASSEVRYVFNKAGGHLGEVGSVAWVFEKKGVFLVEKTPEHDEDELLMIALEAGADDLNGESDYWEIVCDVEHFRSVRESLAEAGIEPESSDLTMFPKNTVPLEKSDAKKVLRLIEALEELDDVHDVYANFDIPDEVLQEEATVS